MSTLAGYYTQGARSAGGHFGAARENGRKHRGQDFSHSTRPGSVGVPALLGGVVVSKTAPSKNHGFGYGITERGTVDGTEYDVSYSHGPWASQQQNGQRLAQGQVILHEGNSGATVGSCVHIEVFNRRTGQYIDPWPFIQRVLGGGVGSALPFSQVVKDRQNWLNFARGEKLDEDGREGPATRDAYRRYQAFLGIGQDGIWGDKTQKAHQAYFDSRQSTARPVLRRGSKGAAVGELQRRLKTNYSLYAGRLVVDDDFGPAVDAAVREFQRRAGLTVDGVVGADTWRALGF